MGTAQKLEWSSMVTYTVSIQAEEVSVNIHVKSSLQTSTHQLPHPLIHYTQILVIAIAALKQLILKVLTHEIKLMETCSFHGLQQIFLTIGLERSLKGLHPSDHISNSTIP